MAAVSGARQDAREGFWVITRAPELPDAAIDAAAAHLRRSAFRLGPCGAEIPAFAPDPDQQRALAAALPGPCDVNWVAAAARRKRLLIADMDSTTITVECIDELADFAGVKPDVSAITERAMRGELDFEGALEARVALLKGVPEAALETCYRERVRLSPGAEVLVRTMAARGAVTALVSGGFTFFTERVAGAAGFGHHRANVLEVNDGALTGRVIPPILGREAKRSALAELLAGAKLSPMDAVAVGDGANDLAMIEHAGLGVAYRAKPAVAAAADAALLYSDLTAILHLQGVPEAEFWSAETAL